MFNGAEFRENGSYHIIHRIDISPNIILKLGANLLIKKILRWEGYSFMRTPLFRKLTERKIKRAVKKFATSDYCLFLNFDFYNSYNAIPSLLFSDWTYKMDIEERYGNQLKSRDLRFVKQQENAFYKAQAVLPLFTETVEKLRMDYPAANICQIPFNVINNMSGINELDMPQIELKFQSDYILFIGRPSYRNGLKKLIDAMRSISDGSLRLEVIGMTKKDFGAAPDFVHFNGWLHKDIPKECERYYDLIIGAKCIINPTSKWAAYSSLVEGMFFYNPIIVTPFNQFVKEFGENINFGMYIDEKDEASLHDCMVKLLSLDKRDYITLCQNAHNKVKDYTWERYVVEMVEIMKRHS